MTSEDGKFRCLEESQNLVFQRVQVEVHWFKATYRISLATGRNTFAASHFLPYRRSPVAGTTGRYSLVLPHVVSPARASPSPRARMPVWRNQESRGYKPAP